MCEAKLARLDYLYHWKDWDEFAKVFIAAYEQADSASKLNYIRELLTRWRSSEVYSLVVTIL